MTKLRVSKTGVRVREGRTEWLEAAGSSPARAPAPSGCGRWDSASVSRSSPCFANDGSSPCFANA
eukprot:scaffold20751_cov124-Isochrysis_galbana.AAC.4